MYYQILKSGCEDNEDKDIEEMLLLPWFGSPGIVYKKDAPTLPRFPIILTTATPTALTVRS